MTVADMLGRISSRELSEWIAYLELEAEDEAGQALAFKAEQNLAARRPRLRRRR